MIKFDNKLQPEKASSPMWVTVSGMVNSTKELQPRKVRSLMPVTEVGMVKLVKEVPASWFHVVSCHCFVACSLADLQLSISLQLAWPPCSLDEVGHVADG